MSTRYYTFDRCLNRSVNVSAHRCTLPTGRFGYEIRSRGRFVGYAHQFAYKLWASYVDDEALKAGVGRTWETGSTLEWVALSLARGRVGSEAA